MSSFRPIRRPISILRPAVFGALLVYLVWWLFGAHEQYREEVRQCALSRRAVALVDECVATTGCEMSEERWRLAARADRYIWENCR